MYSIRVYSNNRTKRVIRVKLLQSQTTRKRLLIFEPPPDTVHTVDHVVNTNKTYTRTYRANVVSTSHTGIQMFGIAKMAGMLETSIHSQLEFFSLQAYVTCSFDWTLDSAVPHQPLVIIITKSCSYRNLSTSTSTTTSSTKYERTSTKYR